MRPRQVEIDPFDPKTRDITTRRKGHDPVFNIEHRHRHHSPSGMEFAYGGSGPADFALNILALFLPVRGDPVTTWRDDGPEPNAVKCWDGTHVSVQAWNLHQRFKEQFITTMNYYGARIPGSEITLWITLELTSRTEPS